MNEITYEIGIVDTRNIISVIKDVYGYDFSGYALTSFKRRLERIIYVHKLYNPSFLIRKLESDKDYFDTFLQELSVESTEMFRDPSLWRYLKENILDNQIKENRPFKVWFPQCVAGLELYSFCILLKEMGILEKVEIHASYISDKIYKKIRSGYIKEKKLDFSEQNYIRSYGNENFKNYIIDGDIETKLDNNLVRKVKFFKQNITFEKNIRECDMIFYRNKMLYVNTPTEENIYNELYRCLNEGGYLIIGSQERFNSEMIVQKFDVVSKSESIYRKKEMYNV